MKLSPILLSLSISGLSLAQGKGDPPTRPAVTVPFKTILGNPLKINVGADTAFQIFNSAVPGGGQIFPTSSSGLADMGAFLRTGGVLYAPRFTDHDQGTATQNLSPYTPWTLVSESAVTGDGSAGNPFTVTVVVDAGTTGIRMTMVVRYVNGQSYFTQSFLFTGSVARTFDFYFGADLYLAASDYGVPFRESSSGSVGGQECPYPPTYTILFIPFTPADRYVAGYYGDVWYYIGSGQPLPNYIDDACLDNGAALQWRNRSVAPEVGDTIGAATSFGTQNIGPSAVFASPAPGDVAGVVTVTALASTSGGATVTSVRLILDGTTLKTCIASPCTATWEAFRGGLIPHILGAEVKDSAGRVATAQINVSVKPVLSGQLVLSDPSNQSATLPFGATQGAALGVKVSGCTYPVGLTVDDQGWFSSTGREDELARCSGPITATATLVYYDNVLDQQAKPRVTTTSAGSSLIPGRPAVITNLRYKGLLVLIHGIRSSPEKWDVWRDYLLGSGYIVFTPTYSNILRTHQSAARDVWSQVQLDLAPFPSQARFAIVGHSRGGVVARAMMWNDQYRPLAGRVSRVFTLGTPHSGTDLIGGVQLLWGLDTWQMYIFNLFHPNFGPTLEGKVFAIEGRGWPFGFAGLCFAPDDGVVYWDNWFFRNYSPFNICYDRVLGLPLCSSSFNGYVSPLPICFSTSCHSFPYGHLELGGADDLQASLIGTSSRAWRGPPA